MIICIKESCQQKKKYKTKIYCFNRKKLKDIFSEHIGYITERRLTKQLAIILIRQVMLYQTSALQYRNIFTSQTHNIERKERPI